MIANFIIICLMIILTSFFVSAEFSFVKIRKTRLVSLKNDGNKVASLSLHIVSHLDEYLSACQLGITLTSLAIGWIGESTIESLLHPLFSILPISSSSKGIISITIAFSIMTFFHVVLGELIPKSISISKTESVVLFATKPLYYFHKLTYPFIWILNHSALKIGAIFKIEIINEEEEHHSEEELLLIAYQSLSKGEINSEEFALIKNSLQFDQTLAREIMVSRIDMDVLYDNMTVEESLNVSINQGHSRYPVIHKAKDNILGYITQKDLIKLYLEDPKQIIKHRLNDTLKRFENTPLKKLLNDMKKKKKHLAILFDEYGGTSGMITVEDIVEEIFGDIQDEQDQEDSKVKKIDRDIYIADGSVELREIIKQFDLSYDDFFKKNDKKITSLAGWMLDNNPNSTHIGSVVSVKNISFEVVQISQDIIITKIKIIINDLND